MKQISHNQMLSSLHALSVQENNEVYAVGGFVRDIILGRPVKDIDVVVTTNADKFARKYSRLIKGDFVILDKENKIFRIIKKSTNNIYTVDISDMRGKNIETDLNLRDFTINSIAVLLNGKPIKSNNKSFIDPANGIADINKKIIRATYAGAFADDPLRILRAYRLAATLNFTMDKTTEELIEAYSFQLARISAERIKEELFKIFSCPDSAGWISRLADACIIEHIIPEVLLMKKSTDYYFHEHGLWEHSIKTLESLENIVYNIKYMFRKTAHKLNEHLAAIVTGEVNRLVILKFCSLFHDAGKPAAISIEQDKVRFYGHEKKGAGIAVEILKRLKSSSREMRIAESVIGNHMRPANLSSAKCLSDRTIFRYFKDLSEEGIDVLLLSLADRYSYKCCNKISPTKATSLNNQLVFTKKMFFQYYYRKNKINPPVLISGSELMSLFNIPEGPEIGRLLSILMEAQADGRVKSKKEAINYLKELIN